MLKIAFCDDDLSVLDTLSTLMDRYRLERSCALTCFTYQSPLELMAAIERGVHWDILLLDILMPGGNGIDLATELRAYDTKVKLIFLTSSPEYALDSYSVNAFYYLLKPVQADRLFPILDRAIDACAESRTENLILKCKSGITAVSPEKLEYCEVIGHSLLLHMKNGSVLESTGKLDDLERKLQPFGSFLRVHRSYLVNMAYIHSISYRAVTLSCLAEIPIPHGKCNELKRAYLNYAFEKECVLP